MSNKKSLLLGENFSTANNKLRKLILFSFVQQLNLDICYRCSSKIKTIETLSIEHKIAWQNSENPVQSFYDLNNIAFSHLTCNSSASDRSNNGGWNKGLITHGISGYRTGCRCDVCKEVYSTTRKDRYIRLKI